VILHGSPEWHARRREGIGASECAAVFGQHQFLSLYDLIASKLGLGQPRKETASMRRGRAIEALVLQEYEHATGHKVSRQGEMMISEERPHLFCTLDGWDETLDEPIEVKYNEWDGREWGDENQYPPTYWWQCQQIMYVTQRQHCHLCVVKATGHQIEWRLPHASIEVMQPEQMEKFLARLDGMWATIRQLKELAQQDKDAVAEYMGNLAENYRQMYEVAKWAWRPKDDEMALVPMEHEEKVRLLLEQYMEYKAAEANVADLKAKVLLALKDGAGWYHPLGEVRRTANGRLLIRPEE